MSKSRINGIDLLLRSTENENRNSEKLPERKISNKEKLTLINFQVSVSLKKEISRFCLENDKTIREFLIELIEEKLNIKQ